MNKKVLVAYAACVATTVLAADGRVCRPGRPGPVTRR